MHAVARVAPNLSLSSLRPGTSLKGPIAQRHAIRAVRDPVKKRLALDRTNDVKSAIASSMGHVGRPIIFASFVLGLGFLAVLPSKFFPGTQFGILAAVVVMLALVFDLVVLPSLMGFPRMGIQKEESMCVRLGS